MTAQVSKTWFNYVPIADAGPQYKDDGSEIILAVNLEGTANEQEMEVALIGSPQTVRLIRVATPNSDGNLSEARRQRINNVIEHMMAVLRLTYDYNIDRSRNGDGFISLGCFSDAEGRPSLNCRI